MPNLQFDQTFAQKYKETAELASLGTAKDKMLRNAARIEIMSKTGQEWQDVLLPIDREPSAYDSDGLYETMVAFPIEQIQAMQHGVQWLNHLDGISCVLIGSFARAHFTNAPMRSPEPNMIFVVPFKFDRLLKHATETGIEVVRSHDGTSAFIPSFACTVYSEMAKPGFEDILSNAKYGKVFGSNILLSPLEDLWDI